MRFHAGGICGNDSNQKKKHQFRLISPTRPVEEEEEENDLVMVLFSTLLRFESTRRPRPPFEEVCKPRKTGGGGIIREKFHGAGVLKVTRSHHHKYAVSSINKFIQIGSQLLGKGAGSKGLNPSFPTATTTAGPRQKSSLIDSFGSRMPYAEGL